MRRLSRLLPVLLILLPAAALAESADWLQFRGSARNGLSPETGIARAWPETGPPELWRRPIGQAFSGIAVQDGYLYTTESDEGSDYALKARAEDGTTVWRQRLSPVYKESFGNGPRATPTLDGGHVYVLAGDGHLAALRASDGEVVWSRDLRADFDLGVPTWGFASAPLVLDSQVILSVGASGKRAVVAFDKANGEVKWTAGEGEAAYGSPVVIEAASRRQLVVVDKPGVLGLSLDGKELWRHEWASKGGIKPALPIFVEPDLLMVSASYGIGALALRLTAEDGGVRATEVWQGKQMRTHFNSSVLRDGVVYGFDNSTLKALDPRTGEEHWAVRGGLGKGSLIYADGLLIVLTETGTLKLVEARRDVHSELASHKVLDGRCWTEPTLAGGHLYLRNGEEMVALDVRGGGPKVRTAVADGDRKPLPSPRGDRGGKTQLTVEEILKRHVAAHGGRERLEALRALRLRGTLEQNGEVGPFTLVEKAPGSFRLEASSFGSPLIVFSDGKAVYQQAFGAPEPKEEDEHPTELILEDQGDFLGPLFDPEKKGHRVELAGEADLDGTPTYQLRVHLKSGRTQDFYLAADSFLLVRKSVRAWEPDWSKEYTRDYWYQGYEEHGGVMVPSLIEQVDDTFTMTFLVESVEVDPDLEEGLFTKPEG